MSDPTDYHQKLAEAAYAKIVDILGLHMSSWLTDEGFDMVAAALASEGVVDPEKYDEAIKRWQDFALRYQKQVDRLTSDRDALRRFIAKHNWQHTPNAAEYEALTSDIEENAMRYPQEQVECPVCLDQAAKKLLDEQMQERKDA